MQRVNFIFNGREYSAQFDAELDCVSVYDCNAARYLSVNHETGVREHKEVWIAAYTMLSD